MLLYFFGAILGATNFWCTAKPTITAIRTMTPVFKSAFVGIL